MEKESFEQLAIHYDLLIQRIIHSLHIYKNRDEFYQHGLIALWEASKRFDPAKGHFSTYAYKYIRGFLLMELSKATKEVERNIYPMEEFWESAADPFNKSPMEKDILLSYSKSLTPNQRKWFLHTALDDLTVAKIAEKEKVSVSTVKSWRTGARDKLRSLMEINE